MIGRIVVAIVVGIIVGLVLLLVGTIIASLGIPIFSTIGKFLETWCWVIGFLAALLSFFGGYTPRIGV